MDLEVVHKRAVKTGRSNAFDSQDTIVSVLKKVEFLKNKWSENCLKRVERWDSEKGPVPDPVFTDLIAFLKRQDKLGSFKTAYATPGQHEKEQPEPKNQRKPAAQVAAASAATPTTPKAPAAPRNAPRHAAGARPKNKPPANPTTQNHAKPAPQAKSGNWKPRASNAAPPTRNVSTPSQSTSTGTSTSATTRVTPSGWECWVCQGKIFHPVDQCAVFITMTVDQRCDIVRQLELCMNCLRKGHYAKDCTRVWTCQQCRKKHHTSVHKDGAPNQPQNQQNSS